MGGVNGHIKAFEKVKQGGPPYKIDAGGNFYALIYYVLSYSHCLTTILY